MKKTIFAFSVILATIPGFRTQAQDVQTNLNEALSSYNSGDLENTRFALQQALTGINQEIGKEVLNLLPSEINGFTKVAEEDNVTGTGYGFAGLFVNRTYVRDTLNASIEIVTDAPMLAGINAILAMPGFMTSDPNQKRIKIGSYKALMTKSGDEQSGMSYDIQMPFSNSLLTFKCNGINDENEVIGMANTIPVDKIVKITQ